MSVHRRKSRPSRRGQDGGPRVVDPLTPAQRLLIVGWSCVAGILGLLLGVRLTQAGYDARIALPGCTLGMILFMNLSLRFILASAGGIARQLYEPTGSHTPSRSAYSGPESLAVRGRFEEAVAAYMVAAEEEPDDPEPWLRIARIERGDVKRPQRALEAYRAARTRVADDSPTAMLIAREIAEIHLNDSGQPQRAMPELARLVANFGGTPTGGWAARTLAELKVRAAAGEFDHWVKGPVTSEPAHPPLKADSASVKAGAEPPAPEAPRPEEPTSPEPG